MDVAIIEAVLFGLEAAFVNVTAVKPVKGGNLTVYPPGDKPVASTLNFQAGQTIANGAFILTAIADEDKDWYVIRIFSTAVTHLVVDLTGVTLRGISGVKGDSKRGTISQRICCEAGNRLGSELPLPSGSLRIGGTPSRSTRESHCPPCAEKARVLRMQQCAEGRHRDHEPEEVSRLDQDRDKGDDPDHDLECSAEGRRVRSTQCRQDASDLPRVVQEPDCRPDVHRAERQDLSAVDVPHLDLAVVRADRARTGTPASPSSYDYRWAALDALHFPKLIDRFWQNLRRSAGYRVQYFAALEPQKRLAPHLHAAIRGAIPKATLRQVIKATYVQV